MILFNEHDVAMELERIISKKLGVDFNHSGTIFSADSIETYSFYDVIILILFMGANKDSIDFQNSIFKYKGLNMNQIHDYKEIYERFLEYIK